MILSADFSCDQQPISQMPNFWQRLLSQGELERCEPLEKLLVGCEIIAALDAVELLAA